MRKNKGSIFIFFVYLAILLFAYSPDLFALNKKEQIVLSDIHGLPRNIVFELAQDQFGYLWVATESGIARYDGIAFYTYPRFAYQSIFTVYVDSKNNVWIGTGHGAYVLNRISDQFELMSEGYVVQFNEDYNGAVYFNASSTIKTAQIGNKGLISSYQMYQFEFVDEGLWYSNAYEGATLLSRKNAYRDAVDTVLQGKNITCIRAINGGVFFACRDGELFVKLKNKALVKIDLPNHYYIRDIKKIDNEIWVATDGNGILVMDQELNYIGKLDRAPDQQISINTNSVYGIMQGKNNEVWVASYGAGLICLLPESKLFKNIVPEKGVKNSLVANEGVMAAPIGDKIILGTNFGFSVYNETTNTFVNFHENRLKKELNGIKIMGAVCDKNGHYWIASYDGLLAKYDSDFNLLKTYAPCSNDKSAMQQIIYINIYKDKYLLIGTQFPMRSMLKLDIDTDSVSIFTMDQDGVKTQHFDINAIRFDNKGELLTQISNLGLFKINIDANTLEPVYQETVGLITSWITDFYQSKNGDFWFATKNGLYQYNANNHKVKIWSIKEGLPSLSLQRIESVNEKYLWISTIKGICRFNTESYEVNNYNYSDGLSANEFSARSSDVLPNKRIIFGSIAGYTIVDPSKVANDTAISSIIISDILFQNTSIKQLSLLKQPIEESNEITLPYNKNSFTIKFFTKNKAIPKYANFSYRLLGFDDDWVSLGHTNQTTFNNLLPGKYTFEVRSATKNNTNENDIIQLQIHIKHPWFLSWYAYLLYALFALSMIVAFFYGYVYRINYKKELEIASFKIQSEHELTEKKLAFFTNISHDLKTPLTLIDAPVSALLKSKNLTEQDLDKLQVIRRNSKRLQKLINDILDFRTLSQKKVPLSISEADINTLFTNVYNAFSVECNNKTIDFYKTIDVNNLMFIDVSKVEQILWNLLSNAIKFTEEDGQIYLVAQACYIQDKLHLKIIVKDSGIGIPSKFIDKIFDRFYQIPKGKTKQREGTGIGLSIVNDLVEIHYGEIEVDSKPNVGTTFTITIPVYKERYKAHEIQNEVIESNLLTFNNYESNEPFINEPTSKNKQYNLPTLLIAEDNFELRKYLCNYFHEMFKIYEAEDGLKGIELARDKSPDMIITDISMPNLSGYEFCKQIRSSFETSHIPVIMLTANSAVEQQIEGLQLGADAYITKPFDIELLENTIKGILENRKRIRNKLLGVEVSDHTDSDLPEKDENFVNDLVKYIEDNMINQDLNVEILAKYFSVNRIQLNKKVKSLTGKTTIRLINSIRLKKAYELIKGKGMRVSEVAYSTGFSDPNYFTICFKKEFGENPSKLS